MQERAGVPLASPPCRSVSEQAATARQTVPANSTRCRSPCPGRRGAERLAAARAQPLSSAKPRDDEQPPCSSALSNAVVPPNWMARSRSQRAMMTLRIDGSCHRPRVSSRPTVNCRPPGWSSGAFRYHDISQMGFGPHWPPREPVFVTLKIKRSPDRTPSTRRISWARVVPC